MNHPEKHIVIKESGYRVYRWLCRDANGIDHYGAVEDLAYATPQKASDKALLMESTLLTSPLPEPLMFKANGVSEKMYRERVAATR